MESDMSDLDAVNAIMTSPDPADAVTEEVFTPEPSLDEMMLSTMVDEADKEEPGETDQPAGEVEEKVEGKRAQKRIKQLVAEKKEAQAAVDNLRQEMAMEMQKQQHQMQLQFQQQLAEVRQQNALLSERVSSRPEPKPVFNNAAEEWEHGFNQRQQTALQQQVNAATRAHQDKLAALELRLAQKEAAEQRQVRLSSFKSAAEKARTEILLKDLPADDAARLAKASDELILTWAAAFQNAPDDAASQLAKYNDMYFNARLKAMQAKAKASVAKNGAAPKAPAVGRVGQANGLPNYTSAQVKKAGYQNYMDAAFDNFRKMGHAS